MGQPRRRFPGGSVGQFFVVYPFPHGLTEEEAKRQANKIAREHNERVYIARYFDHVDPPEEQSA